MKKFYMIPALILAISMDVLAQVSVSKDGNPPDPSAILDVRSTTGGLLLPRMTHHEMESIANPVPGLVVFCTDCGQDGHGALAIFIYGSWYSLSAACINPLSPVAGTHASLPTQITWNWDAVAGATGYKWGETANYAMATDLGNVTSKTETGLTCITPYTRYVWTYNSCGNSAATTLSQATATDPPASPAAGTHVPSPTQIVWNWNTAPGATGYKWNTVNDYVSAADMGTATSKTEPGLTCITFYTRYVWSYSPCGNSSAMTLSQTTATDPPVSPAEGTHVPAPTQIVWNWNTVSGATGYKWNTTNNYGSAFDMGASTSKTETGLACNTSYTRYAWAYSSCGNSAATAISETTSLDPPASPGAGTAWPSSTQIIWTWTPVTGALGYKWNTTDDYNTAVDMGTDTSKTETGLTCNTEYARYVWAFGTCGISPVTTLWETTLGDFQEAPAAGTHIPSLSKIVWNWNAAAGATGYKWNTDNNYYNATDLGTATSKTETWLTCGTGYTRYVWAYSNCGVSTEAAMTQSTLSCTDCGSSITINHITGNVAPVDKTVTYGTVINIPGEPSKCWITSNLGADHQATIVNDPTEPPAGWYWQFNRKQGYKYDGTRTPNTTWITTIDENLDWQAANDPCALELGGNWRIPTYTEWLNVDATGGWTTWSGPWNSGLKIHAAGYLGSNNGVLAHRNTYGYYWSSAQSITSNGWMYYMTVSSSFMLSGIYKPVGCTLRCLRD